ncbi:hypothetical protein E2320_012020 [Naja naja]|nr:hypothetical protein E2320_012020 [Naja naja]
MERSSLRQLIQEQLDPKNTGFVGVETFASLVHSHELPLDPAKLEMLVALAQSNDEDQQQTFQQLQEGHKLGRGQRPCLRMAWPLSQEEKRAGLLQTLCHCAGKRLRDPPIIVFLCYGARLNKWVLQTYHPEYMKSPLVYHPGHRARAWRFLTYMFMHVG